ncbi:MAG: DNA polymerase III subunit delta [Bacteroidota bacterium]
MAEYNEIIKSQQQGKFAMVYFLHGDEPFFIDNIIENVELNALDDTQKSFNQYILYGKETTLTDVMNIARKYPMMGERQVVIVKEAQEMRSWKNEDQANLLIHYLENPTPSTVLVFGYKYKTLDKRTKIAKALEKGAETMLSKRLYDNQIPEWLRSYTKVAGVNLTAKASVIMAENIGNNLQRLANEVDKLKLNIKDGGEVNEQMIQKYVGISKDYNTFELQSAIALKNTTKAFKIVKYMASNTSSNPLVMTLGSLFSFFTKLLILHHNGANDKNEVSRLIGVHPFFASEYLQAKSNYPVQLVTRNIQCIYEADLQSKGIGYASVNEGNILQELVYKLIH